MTGKLIPSEICLACQGCCRFAEQDSVWAPAVLDEDISRLMSAGIPPSLINKNRRVRTVPDLSGASAYACVFLDARDNHCSVYQLRPFECRLYPFLLMRTGDRLVLGYDPHCPYAAQHHSDEQFRDFTAALVSSLQQSSISALLKRNPHVFQEYPHACTCDGGLL
jgi:Fe-S-cluster containining protein